MMKVNLFLTLAVFASSWAARSDASVSKSNKLIHCGDQNTFQYGQILVRSSDDNIEVLLRGYDSHGRAPKNLARDLGLDIERAGVFLWVGAKFEKDRCKIDRSNGVIIGCASTGETGKIAFYAGTDENRLEEIANSSGEIIFLLDKKQQKSLGFDGYFDPESTAGIVEQSFVSGNFFVTGGDAFRSTVSVNITSDQCE